MRYSYRTIFDACLEAAKQFQGDDIKTVSWFKRNWQSTWVREEEVSKKAA